MFLDPKHEAYHKVLIFKTRQQEAKPSPLKPQSVMVRSTHGFMAVNGTIEGYDKYLRPVPLQNDPRRLNRPPNTEP